ncbi:uncharacterized protein [Argopecten irradians]|uniref:uncharacterized protein isoform X1 n=1 Tax=Argopecten irradians TaxID=31199 RepID=UPI003722741B
MTTNMVTDFIWIIFLVTSILVHRGQTSNVTYKAINNEATWIQAAEGCEQLNGTLIDSLEYYENADNISLSNHTYWTSSFSFQTQWVEFKGCFNINLQNTSAVVIQYDDRRIDIGWFCYAYCERRVYFGIIDDQCVCFSENITNLINTNSFDSCPVCTNTSSFQCGTEFHIAVYITKQTIAESITSSQTESRERCLAYNCNKGDGNNYTFVFQEFACQDDSLEVRCNDGFNDTSSITWTVARQKCEERGSFILRHPVDECQQSNSKAPYWDNIHKDTVSFTTGFELRYGIQLHNKSHIFNCSSVSSGKDEPHYDKCNSTKRGYICKIDCSSESHTPIVCTLNQTEPPVPPSHTTTVEATTTRGNNSSHSEHTTISKPKSNNVLYIAVGAGVGGVLIIVITIVIIYICRKRNNNTEKETKEKDEIDLDTGHVCHMEAAEGYLKIKADRSTLRYTDLNKKGGDSYDQIDLPDENSHIEFPKINGKAVHNDKGQNFADPPSTLVMTQGTQDDCHYVDVDNGSALNGKIPKICVQPETIIADSNVNQKDDDDYDHFGQTNIRSSAVSNYDHVHLRNSRKSKKDDKDGSGNYDHMPGVGRRDEAEVDSTYDHAQNMRYSTTSNYDHVVLLGDREGSAEKRVSDDYDHTTNVSKVEHSGEDRGSNYTQVVLPKAT